MLSWIYYWLGYDEEVIDEKQKRQKYLVTEQLKNSKLKLRCVEPKPVLKGIWKGKQVKPVFVKRGKFYKGKLI